MLAGILTDFKDALVSGMSGTSRPAQLQAGGMWIDTTNQSAPTYYWSFKFWTGSVDIEVFRLSVLYGYGGTLISDASFDIQHIAADTAGPILQLIKQRNPSINQGQVLSGDLIGEIRFIGRTATSTDPLVGYLQFTSTDDMTAAAFGGTFSFASTPDATNALAEHFRFIGGYVETVLPHKLNAQILVSQNIATTPSITKLDATYGVAEMTGATVTSILSIDSAGNAKEISIHNRSSANVFLRNENAGGAAADRMTFPGGLDMTIKPQETIALYYCVADTRWKLREATIAAAMTRTVQSFTGVTNSWTAPFTGRVRITSFTDPKRMFGYNQAFGDIYGNYYAWGNNFEGGLGVGDSTSRSSPVAVVGGFNWNTRGIYCPPPDVTNQVCNALAVTKTGIAYAWGDNAYTQLGLGDTTVRSSPVAVLGGLKFAAVYPSSSLCFGLTFGGKLYSWGNPDAVGGPGTGLNGGGTTRASSSPIAVLGGLTFAKISMTSTFPVCVFGLTSDGTAYSWGSNIKGVSGVGNTTTSFSSPVAVVGGLKFMKLATNGVTAWGLTSAGVLYAWGTNTNGELGVGDTTARSSPVAVLGGLTFSDIVVSPHGNAYVMAMTSDGTLYAWGANFNGNLGVGNVTPRSSPVAVLGGLKFSRVAMANSTGYWNIGVTTSNDLYAWGVNADGNLGVGDVTPRSSPVAVLGGLKFTNIFARASQAIGVTPAGAMYSWGQDAATKGALGLGDLIARSSPVAVLGGLSFENMQKPVAETVVDVVSGTVYTITLTDAVSSFGNVDIGLNVDSITIAYDN